jgi:hypothetical protein
MRLFSLLKNHMIADVQVKDPEVVPIVLIKQVVFFCSYNGQHLPDRITVVLYDPIFKCLVTCSTLSIIPGMFVKTFLFFR